MSTKNPESRKGLGNGSAVASDMLRSFVERIERLNGEKAALASDLKAVFEEAKGAGFDVKVLRLLIRERRMERDDFDEQEALLQVYRHALGMLAGTPLGRSAMIRAGVAAKAFGVEELVS